MTKSALPFAVAQIIAFLLFTIASHAQPTDSQPRATPEPQAETIKIRLVNGRDGRPMVGTSSYVNVWVGTERKAAFVVPTDRKGVARIQLTQNTGDVNIPNSTNSGSNVVDHPIVKYDESFQINVPYVLCVSEGSNYSWLRLVNFSTKEILQHGYASPNICGKGTASPTPGQVILFVRPLTWREKFNE